MQMNRCSFATKPDDKQKDKKHEPAGKEAEEAKAKKAGDKESKEEDGKTSDSSDEEPSALTKEDVKKIKQLILDQDKEIEALKEKEKAMKDKLIY